MITPGWRIKVKGRKFAAFACMGLLILMSACSITPDIVVTEKESGKTFNVKKGEVVEIRLLGQLGTGFSWKAAISSEYLEQVGSDVLTGDKQETSGWDTQVFQFKALKEGSTNVKFQYKRHWEKKEIVKKEFNCTVTIK